VAVGEQKKSGASGHARSEDDGAEGEAWREERKSIRDPHN
jgi:hypothetical protein